MVPSNPKIPQGVHVSALELTNHELHLSCLQFDLLQLEPEPSDIKELL